jgi:hypothetical protein
MAITDKHNDDALRYEDSTGRVRAVRGGVTAPAPIAATPTIANVAGTIPAGGTGTSAGGWDTAGNRDTAITTMTEIRTQLNALLTELRAKGYVN